MFLVFYLLYLIFKANSIHTKVIYDIIFPCKGCVILLFSLNQFLLSMTKVIDTIEKDIFHTSLNHSRRVAYISLLIGKKLKLTNDELFDLASYALLHDIGISSQNILTDDNFDNLNVLEKKHEHCQFGESIISHFPINNPQANVIKYHHEFYNGSGYFGIKGDDIPFLARIICLADNLDILYPLETIGSNKKKQQEIINHVKNNINVLYGESEVLALLDIIDETFFSNFLNDNYENILIKMIPSKLVNIEYSELNRILSIYSHIIDSKSSYTYNHTSELVSKAKVLIDHYAFSDEEKEKFIIATFLHDIGKIGISNSILEKPGKLTYEEFAIIKEHPTIGYHIIKDIPGLEDVAQLVYSHHEKLNGLGYPRGLKGEEISFPIRLLTVLDIYQSITENRPYHQGLSHQQAILILNDMARNNEIDQKIVNDVNQYLGK